MRARGTDPRLPRRGQIGPGRSVSGHLAGAPVAQLDRVPGYEPGGREFESLRARQSIKYLRLIAGTQWTERSENVAFDATFAPRGGSSIRITSAGRGGCRSMRLATEDNFSGARCA
jgi:hypothetical protein